MPIVSDEELRRRQEEERKRKEVVRPPEEQAVLERERAAGLERRGGLSAQELNRREKERAVKAKIQAGQTEAGARRAFEAEEEALEPAEITPEKEAELAATFEERRVFEEPVVEPIIPPEKENLGVIARIIESVAPKAQIDFLKGFNVKLIEKNYGIDLTSTEPIPLAQITMIEEDIKAGIIMETSVEIDTRIEQADGTLVEIGLLPAETLPAITKPVGVTGVVTAGVVGGAVSAPIKEFVGTDGQIASLELALSQYNEMITIPSRSLAYGLPPEAAFDKYDRMEASILALESQLKVSALTSTKVALALRGRGVEARLLKLKEKLQEGRLIVAQRMAQEAFREVDIPSSMAFIRRLQNERREEA